MESQGVIAGVLENKEYGSISSEKTAVDPQSTDGILIIVITYQINSGGHQINQYIYIHTYINKSIVILFSKLKMRLY